MYNNLSVNLKKSTNNGIVIDISLQLPYLVDGDKKIVQSSAIMRYIARKHNMCKYNVKPY